jgi:hypothetical protein
VSGHEVVRTALLVVPQGATVVGDAFCPAGKKVVGGGYNFEDSGNPGVVVTNNNPETPPLQHFWRVALRNGTAGPVVFFAWAVCLNA